MAISVGPMALCTYKPSSGAALFAPFAFDTAMTTPETSCRLCNAPTAQVFEKTLLGKHSVRYYQCSDCGCLQTETPYWLDEAYVPENEQYDTGQVQRSLQNAAFVRTLLKVCEVPASRVVDFGCGSGLAVRLLRDLGFDAWGFDRFSAPRLALGFQTEQLAGTDVFNLCEVAEHLDQPRKLMDELLAVRPALVVVQTGLLEAIDPDWPYLAPDHGQHIFFWTMKGWQMLAAHHGMVAFRLAGFTVLASSEMAGRLFDMPQGTFKPALAPLFQDPLPAMFADLATFQYRFAQADNTLLLANATQPVE